MKKLLLFLLLIVSASNIQAQDVIVKKDGSTIVCRVVEVNSSEIVYKKWTDLNGSNYVMNRADASAINYQNGKRENLGEMTSNLYAPNNQNTGAQMVNDKALLAMDVSTHDYEKRAKTLKTIGWIGGGIILAGAGAAMIIGSANYVHYDGGDALIIAAIGIGGSAAWALPFLSASKHYKKLTMQQYMSLWQNEIKFKNGSSLTAGVDVLKDQMLNNQTIGLGLSYNF